MKLFLQHIALLAAVLIVSASCSRNEAEIIPRSKMAKIYAEMLVTDQWISTTPGLRIIADTSLVYEPILEKYGYDSDDYRASVDFYMNDPERFARIFRTSGEILDRQIAELNKELQLQEARKKLPKIKADFRLDEFVMYFSGEPYVHYHDSLSIVLDSSTRMYHLKSIETADTLYEGLRMVVTDTLAVDDSIAPAVNDSIVPKPDVRIAPDDTLVRMTGLKKGQPLEMRNLDLKRRIK